MKKMLFLTSRLPFPPIGGDKLRTFNFLKYIKERYKVTLVSFVEHEMELEYLEEYRDYYDEVITILLPRMKSYLNCMVGLFSSTPLQIHYYNSGKLKSIIEEELQKGYDFIFCHLIRMGQYLPADKEILKVVDFTDAISLNYHRSKQYRKGLFSLINSIESRRVLNYEHDIIRRADISIFISSIDAEFLKNSENREKIKIVANGVDLNRFQYYDGDYDSNNICFVGNMRTFPNTDAVLFFVKEVFPQLKAKKADLRFYIVGTEPGKSVQQLHNGEDIIVTGFVDDVIPYINNSALLIAPMRVGAGVQNKILEAMALGTPVVTTSIGAEGLAQENLLIGDTPAALTEKILELVNNPETRRKKASAGRKYIESQFKWEQVLSSLDDCLNLK